MPGKAAPMQHPEIAGLAPLVAEAAREGDAMAPEISCGSPGGSCGLAAAAVLLALNSLGIHPEDPGELS